MSLLFFGDLLQLSNRLVVLRPPGSALYANEGLEVKATTFDVKDLDHLGMWKQRFVVATRNLAQQVNSACRGC